jgi:hypothetical protein
MYQLVLQLPTDALFEVSELVALEDRLIAILRNSAEVDGHDMGSGEANIFVRTGTPAQTFEVIKPVLKEFAVLDRVTAAYRGEKGQDYAVIWPKDFGGNFVVT